MSDKTGLAITIGVGVVGAIVLVAVLGSRKPATTARFNPWSYDINGNGIIDAEEALRAIDDNLAGRITFAQLQSVLALTLDKELLAAMGVDLKEEKPRLSPVLPVKRQTPQLEPVVPPTPIATYTNEETWDIEWSKDGLPTRITVHRDARRA